MRTSTATSTLRWAAAALTGLALITVPGVASAWPAGDTAPVSSLKGAATGLVQPGGLAFDAQGRMYVAESTGSIRVFANGATGDATPIKTLQGSATGLGVPIAIEFDAAGRMYVANAQVPSITVYAPNWRGGNTAPIKTLKGPNSGLVSPFGIAFDSAGLMYVADVTANVVSVFAANWPSGDRRPVKYLGGPNSGITGPSSVNFDRAGQMYVTNAYANSITVHGARWAGGDTPPVKVLSGPDTGLEVPVDLAFDYLGRMNVVNRAGSTCRFDTETMITQWPGNWAAGNTPPTQVLKGANTQLRCPLAVAFGPTGLMTVTNQIDGSVTAYAADVTVSIKGSRTSPTTITLTGVTSGVARGASITAYVRVAGSGSAFVAQRPIKLTKGDLTRGTFTYPITRLTRGKAYEVHVMIGASTSPTITVRS